MTAHPLLEPLRALHRSLRDGVVAACEAQEQSLADVAEDGAGDTLYAIDKVSEALLIEALEQPARDHGGVVLIAEGVTAEGLALPRGADPADCRYRLLVDPIDGTRGLMYQKRPAWILSGVAENRGAATRLRDIELALQTEIPLLKQHLCDELWAERGRGAQGERVNRLDGTRRALALKPSQASSIEHGFAMVSRFFPGARDVLAAIDEEIVEAVLGQTPDGKARCFEDQYISTGGQLYELMIGHDRFVADLRPLLGPVLSARGRPRPLCCHPYDLCSMLVAEELGVVLRAPDGNLLDAPFDVESDVAWVGYANARLHDAIGPALQRALGRHGLC